MKHHLELFKVISGNTFSQGDADGKLRDVWLGPWHRLRKSQAHNVYYNKKVLPTSDSRAVVKVNKLNRLTKLVSFSLLKDCIAFAIIMLGIIYIFPLAVVALGIAQ